MQNIFIAILVSSILHFLFGKVTYKGVEVDDLIIKWFICLFACSIISFAIGLPVLGLIYIIKLL